MRQIDFISRLRASKLSLSVSEQRVASVCLEDPRRFARMPVGEIAELAHVSKPTVVRFCRSVGFEGLQDLKRRIAHTSENYVPFIHQSVAVNEKPVNVAFKLIDDVIASMLSVRESIHPDAISAVVDSLRETHAHRGKVICFGVGASALAAQDSATKLYRLGVAAFAFADGHSQCMAASLANSRLCFYFERARQSLNTLDGKNGNFKVASHRLLLRIMPKHLRQCTKCLRRCKAGLGLRSRPFHFSA